MCFPLMERRAALAVNFGELSVGDGNTLMQPSYVAKKLGGVSAVNCSSKNGSRCVYIIRKRKHINFYLLVAAGRPLSLLVMEQQ